MNNVAQNQKQSKHTPGPWVVCECNDNDAVLSIEQDRETISEEPSIIAEVDLCGDGISRDAGAANARLIAASPDLLDVCKRVLTKLEEHERRTGVRQFAIVWDDLRAAIAKAVQA